MNTNASRPDSRGLSRRLVVLLVGCLLLAALPGCATRTVRHSHYKENLLEVDFVRQVKGFTTEEKGYEHPAIISKERLANILGAIEVETRGKKSGTVRQPAFHPEIIDQTAEALASAFAEIGPNEEVAITSIRKQMRIGIFHLKYVTSFLAYINDEHLYLLLRRVDWLVPKGRENAPYPRPIKNKKAMNFRVVSGDPLYFAGVQDLEIDWRSEVFRTAFRLPGTTSGEKRRRDVLFQSPVPKDELEEANRDSLSYGELNPDQLRALADLEEERQEGRITEMEYQRAKRQMLRKR